ncbi:hypothetical protein F2Q69_00058917 [Brassica cretica]|uniref:Uncharacterized protein n=1 Tax=Brassica cretica TaxID=69181 RepID=A0A8S9RKY7_BRACR|nr:hypothetical protein F2Q69_00058917 [Brassica cretica]
MADLLNGRKQSSKHGGFRRFSAAMNGGDELGVTPGCGSVSLVTPSLQSCQCVPVLEQDWVLWFIENIKGDKMCNTKCVTTVSGSKRWGSSSKKLLRILLDYEITHLYQGFQALTPENKSEFFKQVNDRYPQVVEVDLPNHIRTTQGGVKNFINIVAEILKKPSKTRSTVDVEDLHFLP